MATKIRCRECGWDGTNDAVLRAQNPFEEDPLDVVYGCPNCKSVDQFEPLCDQPECKNLISCGTPTLTGYRQTCYDHRPKEPTP